MLDSLRNACAAFALLTPLAQAAEPPPPEAAAPAQAAYTSAFGTYRSTPSPATTPDQLWRASNDALWQATAADTVAGMARAEAPDPHAHHSEHRHQHAAEPQ